MAFSKILCLNLVRRKHVYSSFPSLSHKLFYSGGGSSRNLSSFGDLKSFPSLMLTPEVEEEEKDVTAATTTTTTEKTLNLRFMSLAAAAAGENIDDRMVKNMADHVVKLKKKVPKPLLDAYCVGSSHGWLAYRCTRFDPNNSPPFYFANVLSSTTNMSPEIIPLPSFTYLSDTTKKVALSSAPNDEKNKCVVLLIDVLNVDDDEYKDQLAFCRIGDSSWTFLDSPLSKFCDIVYSKKKQLFYVLTSYTGNIEAWDLHSSSSPRRIETEIEYPYPPFSEDEQEIRADPSYYQYLVESPTGDILRIMRYVDCPDGSFRFDVYKIDFRRQKAEYLHGLGDTALFLGYNHSFALSVRDYPGLIPNSIYFAEDHFHSNMGTGRHYAGFDCGVYDLEDDTVQPFFPSHLNKNLEPLLWLAPNP